MVVEIKEHKIKFGFGLYFLGKAQSDKNTDLNGLLKGLRNNSDIIDLMYLSAKTEAYLDEKELPFNRREFVSFLLEDENSLKIIKDWELQFVEDIKGHFLPDNDKVDNNDVKKK